MYNEWLAIVFGRNRSIWQFFSKNCVPPKVRGQNQKQSDLTWSPSQVSCLAWNPIDLAQIPLANQNRAEALQPHQWAFLRPVCLITGLKLVIHGRWCIAYSSLVFISLSTLSLVCAKHICIKIKCIKEIYRGGWGVSCEKMQLYKFIFVKIYPNFTNYIMIFDLNNE